MRPIFSGATDNSNLTHDIQFWINKFGIEHLHTIIGAWKKSRMKSIIQVPTAHASLNQLSKE
jgi:hypothetical protein